MHYERAEFHPVPLDLTERLPCGCTVTRTKAGDDSWEYIHQVNPNCRFDVRKVGRVMGGYRWVAGHD